MTSMTPDAQLTQRIQQAISLRDKARDTEIQMRTAAEIARQQADAAKAQAKAQFNVNSLEELQAKAAATYTENLANVVDFEERVKMYVTSVNAAKTIGEGNRA